MAIYKRDIADINLETGNIHRSFLNHSIGYMDQKADHFGIRVFRNGEPVDLTGVSVQGVFMPPQGSPIAITSGNIVSGNVAEVVLPQACYNYDGQFCLSIKLVDSTNSVTGTMRIVDGMVDNTHASGTVAPTSAVPTYQEVLSAYDAMIAATAAANGAIAPLYANLTFPVKAGQYTIVDGALKRAIVDIATSETYTAAHWTNAKLGPDLSDVKSAFDRSLEIPGRDLLFPANFTSATNVSYSVDAETGAITVTNNSSGKYNNLGTENTWAKANLTAGKTYRLYAKAEKISGTPNMIVAIRGTSDGTDVIAKSIEFGSKGGEGFVDFVADSYMNRVALFVALGASTNGSVSKFSVWVKELNTTGIDDIARDAIEMRIVSTLNGVACNVPSSGTNNGSLTELTGYNTDVVDISDIQQIRIKQNGLNICGFLCSNTLYTAEDLPVEGLYKVYVSNSNENVMQNTEGYKYIYIMSAIQGNQNYNYEITVDDVPYNLKLAEGNIINLFDYLNTVRNDENNLINYGYGNTITKLNAVPSATDGSRVGVERYGTLVKLNCTNANANKRIRITGDILRNSGNDTYKTWVGQLQLTEGKKYKIKWHVLSGTVSGDLGIVVYEHQGASSIATNLGYDHDGNVIYQFTAPASKINIGFYIGSGATLTDLLSDVTLSEWRDEESTGIFSYYETEMSETIEKVRNEITEPALVFPFVTDMHRYSSNATAQNFDETIENLRYAANRIPFDFILNGGDLTDGNKTKEVTLERAYDCLQSFMSIGVPYVWVQGNHDNNYFASDGAYKFTLAECFKAYFTATKVTGFNASENGTEYYIDFETHGTRLIVLNANNSADRYAYNYGTSTAEWLASALNTNKKVIIVMHQSPISDQVNDNQSTTRYSGVVSAIESFINNGGKLIQISGHSHCDIAFIDPWLSVMSVCERFTANNGSSFTPDQEPNGIKGFIDLLVYQARANDTYTKDAWDVCVYKPLSDEFDMIRFGAGTDRHFHTVPIAPATLTTKLTGTITWSSSDTDVATVSDGVVTGVATGKCAVLAKDENYNYECWIISVS